MDWYHWLSLWELTPVHSVSDKRKQIKQSPLVFHELIAWINTDWQPLSGWPDTCFYLTVWQCLGMYHIVSHCVILCYVVSNFHIVSNCVMTKGPFFSRWFSLPWIWIMGNFYRCLGWFWSREAQYVNSWWKVIPNGYKSKSKHMKFISISLSILKNLYFKHRSWRHLKWNSFVTNCSDPTPKLDHPYNTHMFDAKLFRLVYLERFFF